MTRRPTGVVVAVVAALALVAPGVVRSQEPSLAVVLARAAGYVSDFRQQLSGIVAEESYEQRARSTLTGSLRGVGSEEERRRLRSDFLLVRPEGDDRYHEFRDVFEVNGRPVRDRQERLTRLFLDESASAAAQIQGIVNESARYNIGNIERTLNTPTLALLVLHPDYQPRFRFSLAAGGAPMLPLGADHVPSPASVWVVEFEEVWPNTLVRGENGKDLPAEGRFWIEPTTGRVMVSELIIDDPYVRAVVDVVYRPDPVIGHLVPIEMRERYRNRRYGARVDGTATYSRFRRFEVQVQESAPIQD